MFQPKVKEGEKEYVNEIMIWDPFFEHNLSFKEREKIRLSDPEKGHVWLSIDPAETNVALRLEKRFSQKKPEGIMSIKFSVYNHPLQFGTQIPAYGFLDEAICLVCKNKAKFIDIKSNYYCGIHGRKIESKKEIVYGRKAICSDKDKFKTMDEYHHVTFLLNYLDLKQVRFAVIEQQMAINYRSSRLAQHITSTLISILAKNQNFPIIYEISPKIKSRVYGVQLPKPELKKWTLRKAVFNAIVNMEIPFLRLILKDDNPEKLIQMYRQNELSEGVLWDLIEPERNTVITKEKNKIRKENGVLTRGVKDLFDLCDSKEQIESLIIELGYHNKIYFKKENVESNHHIPLLLPPL